MNAVLKSKHFFLSTISSSISPQIRNFISTLTVNSPPQNPENLLTNHRFFSNGDMDSRNFDYELSLVSALKLCASLLSVSQGEQIHALVLKTSLDSNMFVHNSLINMYAKCRFIDYAELLFRSCFNTDVVSCKIMMIAYVKLGRLNDAHQLFVKLSNRDKDCVSYTTMIKGLARNEGWIESINLFKEMLFVGILPNEVTLASVISAFSHLGGAKTDGMIHGLVAKLGIEDRVLISTNLVHLYCICLNLSSASIIFEKMPEKNIVSWNVMLNGFSKAGLVEKARNMLEKCPVRDVITWGTMINAYVQDDKLSEAFAMYKTMQQSGLAPNRVMIVDLVSACGRSMEVGKGQQIHSTIVKKGFDCYDFVQATIIHFYGVCNRVDLALLQFELGIKTHLPSWNALISGYVKNKMIDQARRVFEIMPKRDVFSWSVLISGYTQTDQPVLALELFHDMLRNGVQANEVTMVSVLSSIASKGTLEHGKLAHDYIRHNHIFLNDNLIAALIDMYAKCGSINTALELFNDVRGRVHSISPWNAIICGLAMNGQGIPALEKFQHLQRLNIELNSITFIGVLTACCHAGLVEIGEEYFKSMKSVYNIHPNIKHYGCMVDLYGRAGKLEAAASFIKNMPIKPDVMIWGALLAASKLHANLEIGEVAAACLAKLDNSHGGSRVLLSNTYAGLDRWNDSFQVREEMQSQRMPKLSGISGVV